MKEMEKKICNCCGKALGEQQDYLYIEKEWNYFSEKDGQLQKLRICETCYDEWTNQFKFPPQESEAVELV